METTSDRLKCAWDNMALRINEVRSMKEVRDVVMADILSAVEARHPGLYDVAPHAFYGAGVLPPSKSTLLKHATPAEAAELEGFAQLISNAQEELRFASLQYVHIKWNEQRG